MPVLHPSIKWAQRKKVIYIQVGIRDIEEEQISFSSNTLSFVCTANKNQYEFNVQFFDEVDFAASKFNKTGFHMLMVIAKKDTSKPYWPRLTKSNAKSQYIQIDWNKWVEEDEEEEEGQKGLGGIDEGAMKNFNDSDDEQEEKKKANIDDLDADEPLEGA